jgi:hypothetical protein
MRDEGFITYLETKAQPLPQIMIDALVQISYGTSYKTVLKNQLSTHYTTAIRAAHDIIRAELFNDIIDYTEVRTWWNNIGGYQSDLNIISTYMVESNYPSALALLDLLPTKHELTADELLDYDDYKTLTQIIINALQQGRNMHQYNSNELASITALADNGYGVAAVQAQNILTAVQGNHYYDCPSLPDNMPLKSIHPGKDKAENDLLQIDVKPNPANTWVAFDYFLPPQCKEGTITLLDARGQIVKSIIVNSMSGQEVLDTRSLQSGLYLYIFEAGGMRKSGKLIIR